MRHRIKDFKVQKGILFDIKRYAIHDGPGIRTTVFFKGCTLHCQWCHNPEGIVKEPEIMYSPQKCAENCRDCVTVCPNIALSKQNTVISIDRAACDLCGDCGEACAYQALEIVGQTITVQEVLGEIDKDRIFYEESHGGVTFSGGEPLAQPDFLMALCRELTLRNIHTALDTSGHVSFDLLDEVSEHIELFLYDLKLMDEDRHREFTGESNALILDNLKKLAQKDSQIVVRMPIIAGVNDNEKNIQKTAEFLAECGRLNQINLLPYHKGGREKHKRLGKKTTLPDFQAPSQNTLKGIKEIFSACGLTAKIGG